MYGRCHILGESGTSPQQVFPCISTWPAAGSGPHLSPARIPEGKLFRDLGPPIPLDPDYKFLRSPLRPTPPSCVTCLLGPLHGCPTSRGSISRDLPAVQPAASRGRGFTSFPCRGSCLTVLLSAPRAFSQSPSGMTVSDQLVKNNFLSIGVSPVTLACFPVGSTRVVSGRFLSHSFGPAPLARSPACHLDLFPAHSFWLLPAPVHPQRSWGISRPGRESTQLSSCWLLIGVWRPPCTQPLQCPGEHK